MRKFGIQQKNLTYGIMNDNLTRQTNAYNQAVSRQMTRDEQAREQANFEREMNYKQEQADRANQQWQEEMNLKRDQYNTSNSQWEREMAYKQQQADRDYEINNRNIDYKYANAGVSNPTYSTTTNSTYTETSPYDALKNEIDKFDLSQVSSDIEFMEMIREAGNQMGLSSDETNRLISYGHKRLTDRLIASQNR